MRKQNHCYTKTMNNINIASVYRFLVQQIFLFVANRYFYQSSFTSSAVWAYIPYMYLPNVITRIIHNVSYISDIDECLNNPCENEGTCINTDGSYTCICADGYEGKDCQNGKYWNDNFESGILWKCIKHALFLCAQCWFSLKKGNCHYTHIEKILFSAFL